jgi:glycosyltransferase 2 family protein
MPGLPRIPGAVWRILRIVAALGALIILAVKVGHTKPLERLASANLLFIVLAVGVAIVDGMVRAWNWAQVIRAMHLAPRVPYRTVLNISWAGAFLGQVLPSTVGTDALRAVLAVRKIGGLPSAHGAAVVMLNAISLVACCIAGLVCALWLQVTQVDMGVRPVVTVLFSGPILVAACSYWLLRSKRGLMLRGLRMMRGPWRNLRRGVRRFTHRMLVFERYDVHPAGIFSVAFITLLTRALLFALVGHAVGVHLPFAAWIALVPSFALSGLIPYSVAGYGGDQAVLVYVLTGFGVSAGAALAFALIVPLTRLAFNMLGGLSLVFGKIDAIARSPTNPPASPVHEDRR